MHENIIEGKRIESSYYLRAFHQWKQNKENANKNSRDFDKIIGIGEWAWMDAGNNERKRSFVIKDSKKFFLAVLKYDIL